VARNLQFILRLMIFDTGENYSYLHLPKATVIASHTSGNNPMRFKMGCRNHSCIRLGLNIEAF